DPVAVTFPKPLDYGLLQRALAVSRGATTLAGDTRIADGETRWEFVPRSEWQRGPYALTVLPILEDLAGNRIGRAFEVRSKGDAVPPESSAPVSVPFIVRYAHRRSRPQRTLPVSSHKHTVRGPGDGRDRRVGNEDARGHVPRRVV